VFLGLPRRFVRATTLTLLIAFVTVPFIGLPYSADDTVNRNWPQAGWIDGVSEAWRLQRTWMFEQGRFFPGGSVYALVMWNAFQSRAAYMTYLALLSVLIAVLIAYVVWRLTRSAMLGAFAAVTFTACLQLRFGYLDGVASFAGLVGYTLALTLIAGLIAAHILRGGSHWWVILVAVAWSLAITAYEVSLLMLPAILLLLWATGPSLRDRARWAWATLPLIVPAALALGVTFYLRRRELPLAPAYQVDLSGPVASTFGKQFTAALPFSQQGIAGAPIFTGLSILLALVLAVPAFLAWRPWGREPHLVGGRVNASLLAAGVWAWVVPSALAAVTVRWQTELIWGQGYIYLPYEFAGFTLVMTGIAGAVRAHVPRPWARVALGVFFGAMVIACALTAGVNIVNVGTIVPGAQGPG